MTAPSSSHSRSNRPAIFLLCAILFVVGAFVARNAQESRTIARSSRFKQRCQEALEQSNWEALVEIAQQWSQLTPEEADVWLFMGEGYLQTGKLEKACTALGRVPSEDEKAIPALIKKAEIEFDLLHLPLVSEKTCLELLKLEPRVAEVRARLIFFYALTLQRVRLIEQIRESIKYGSDPPEAYVYLLLCDHLYFTNGAKVNSVWLKSNPDSEIFQVAAAVQFDEIMQRLENQTDENKERMLQSREKIELYLKRYPENSALLRYFLQLYTDESQVNDVVRILGMVPSNAGDDSIFWRFRGWYQAATNDLENAEKAYRKSLELTGIDWRSWQGLSEVVRLKGDFKNAERYQKIALRGKKLRQDLLQLPTAKDITDKQLKEIAEYAADCGEDELAEHLEFRLRQRGFQR